MEYFPEQIECWQIELENEWVAGIVLFNHAHVRHLQYTSATPKGKKNRALDYLINQLLTDSADHYKYISMGTSIDPDTQQSLAGLTRWKQSWGAQAYPSNIYELNLKHSKS
ncbi:hypothetical protein [Mongoliitalea daihaiensis]|uniref:hypothetical protein n=1 Tax=Mongoliitalea daihaiensis TaxID=2782006 RepID=UPI001F39A5FD|nr:hypothetical protein [Mongoliitalea daihaiensis]UJP64183.1 hypothetical protein IPZ59_15390 [Mongoliitalea daihaiensis]